MLNFKLISRFLLPVFFTASFLTSCASDKLEKDAWIPSSDSVLVVTKSGPVQGTLKDGIAIFKGIPYAEPPVGTLRFAPTKEVRPWKDILIAEKYGPTAIQAKPVEEGLTMDEDCLNLNIWAPVLKKGEEKLPVYVFIHGGGYANGSGAKSLYDGTNFAKSGIVTVTINYRLNALGFLATNETLDEYGTTGNWGLLDQIQALKWIKANIKAFGGDPDNVTIGGESAGAYSVSALVLSPLAKGLFQGAILESGSILSVPGDNYYAKGDLKRSIEVSNMLAYTFNAKDNAKGLAKLRAADPHVLAQLSPLNADMTQTTAFLMFPVYDGKVLPKDPIETLEEGDLNGVRLMFGYNADEGSIFIPAGTSAEAYKMLVYRIFGAEKANAVLERFPITADRDSTERARQILAYGILTPGMKEIGDAFAKRGMDVYAYYFSYTPKKLAEKGLGSAHALELPFVFKNKISGDEMETLADEMHTRWVNFIKTGDPNRGTPLPTDVRWQKYDPKNTRVIHFDTTVKEAEMPDRENLEFMQQLLFRKN